MVLSRRLLAAAKIRIEHIGVCALPAGMVTGADFMNPAVIAAALAEALLTCRCKRALTAARVAMALPATAAWLQQLSIARLAPQSVITTQSDTALDALESAVLAQAEHLAGIEAAALAVDWFRADPAGAPDQLTIVATPRRYVEVRLEAAAQAGMMLHAIDGADAAALRACRFAGMQSGRADMFYGAIWLATPAFITALHDLIKMIQPVYVLIAGEVETLRMADRTIDELSVVLGCPVIELDPLACCNRHYGHRNGIYGSTGTRSHSGTGSAQSASPELGATAPFAVVFGLALRWML
ncbi:hypothetical protein BGZ96_007251 [Linnemannia gamsii]|uniref:Uncharacterized protein n=1 Tax=Linnemannia gamsii TaxID=64522 RepID=A0ABQ7K295_9FUNG|nr:hypothetical protein BGZ96_007251 [Linnemannia gamsii]